MTQYNQCQIEYMLANGGSGSDKGQITRNFLLAQGVKDAAIGDMWYEFLIRSCEGSRTRMESQFWYDVGCRSYDPGLVCGLRAIQGWTGLENCYVQQPATFAGNSALFRTMLSSAESNEGTISMWIKNTSPTGSIHRIYDIGDPVEQSSESTRLSIGNSGTVDSRIAHFDDPAWSPIASINNIPLVANEWHHYFVAYKNNTIDGDDKMQVFFDGVQVGIDETFNPPDNTVSLLAGDNIVIGARHDLDAGVLQGFVGEMADIWTGEKYMDPIENIPFFRSDYTDAEYVNGTPKYISRNMNDFIAENFLGGQGYTIEDWNSGVNRGVLGNFILSGDPLVEPA